MILAFAIGKYRGRARCGSTEDGGQFREAKRWGCQSGSRSGTCKESVHRNTDSERLDIESAKRVFNQGKRYACDGTDRFVPENQSTFFGSSSYHTTSGPSPTNSS